MTWLCLVANSQDAAYCMCMLSLYATVMLHAAIACLCDCVKALCHASMPSLTQEQDGAQQISL